jgi:hypothetical protein
MTIQHTLRAGSRTALWLTTLALLTAVATGCFTMDANVPGTLRTDLSKTDYEKVGEIKHEYSHWFFLWGLVGQPEPDVFANIMKTEVQKKGADGVANFTLEGQWGCFDLGVGCVTLGIISPRTYNISADIVRVKTTPLPGKPAKAATAAKPGTVAQAF